MCERHGVLVACAVATWMNTPNLQTLGLVDCRPLTHDRAEDAQGHAAFTFARAAWLRLPNLQLRCYWGRPSRVTWHKTSALLHALYEQLPNKRFYLKVDPDTCLRPVNLIRFLNALFAMTSPDEPLYFGSAQSRDGCTQANCRMFVFNSYRSRNLPDEPGPRAVRVRAPGGHNVGRNTVKSIPLREETSWQQVGLLKSS